MTLASSLDIDAIVNMCERLEIHPRELAAEVLGKEGMVDSLFDLTIEEAAKIKDELRKRTMLIHLLKEEK